MKLSDHLVQLDTAFTALLSTSSDVLDNHIQHRRHRRIRTDLALSRPWSDIPIVAPSYDPLSHRLQGESKLLLIKLVALKATYHNENTDQSWYSAHHHWYRGQHHYPIRDGFHRTPTIHTRAWDEGHCFETPSLWHGYGQILLLIRRWHWSHTSTQELFICTSVYISPPMSSSNFT